MSKNNNPSLFFYYFICWLGLIAPTYWIWNMIDSIMTYENIDGQLAPLWHRLTGLLIFTFPLWFGATLLPFFLWILGSKYFSAFDSIMKK